MGTNTISFHVSGMSCSACATRLEKSLQKSENVISASVNFALETANLELHKITPLKKIQKWVRDAGFEVVTETHQFALPKECSQGEINSLMDALRDSQEIIDVSLSSSNSRLKVVYISHATSKNLILDIAHGKGIHLGLLDDSDNKTGISVNILRNEFIKVISAVILTLPFFLMMLFNHV
ncbi:MAG: heavy metal-associated domain-containing protein, partial [Paracoccaceae bacterium]|nr:heavy metal-associated domain-containing protein [Paracoccaceae bacterium]